MTTTRLSLYNGALRECQERELTSLSENRSARRLLDSVWASGRGLVDAVLEQGQWRFARRTVELMAEPDLEPAFGYVYAFTQPGDLVRTCALCSDPYMQAPLLQYQVEASYWYADTDPLYVSYVSNDPSYGGDLTTWPPNFVLWVETYLASLIVGRLTMDAGEPNRVALLDFAEKRRLQMVKLAERRKRSALNTDAAESPTRFPPAGSWVRARLGHGSIERGRRSQLIG